MKKFLLLGFLACSSVLTLLGQDQPGSTVKVPINRDNLVLRPNSRDYAIVRKGNNHQRLIQMRKQAMMRNRQAMINRQMVMECRHSAMQQKIIRQQQIRQRMVHQRGIHR